MHTWRIHVIVDDDQGGRFRKDKAHLLHLILTLIDVRLIDTDGIDPYPLVL